MQTQEYLNKLQCKYLFTNKEKELVCWNVENFKATKIKTQIEHVVIEHEQMVLIKHKPIPNALLQRFQFCSSHRYILVSKFNKVNVLGSIVYVYYLCLLFLCQHK